MRFESLRARSLKNNVMIFNVLGPIRPILPGGINAFIHSFKEIVSYRLVSKLQDRNIIAAHYHSSLGCESYEP